MYSDLMLYTASDTFRILAYSALLFFQLYVGIFKLIQHSAYLSYIHAYWGIIKAYSGLFRHIQHSLSPSHIHNLAIFWALAYLEPEAYLEPCETLTRHIQNPAIGHYSAIFRHNQNFVQPLDTQKPYSESWNI